MTTQQPRADVVRETDNEIVLDRTFNAPRQRVWAAFTDPAQLATWWGPTGFTTETSEMELRPGGRWRFVMRGPDGHDYPNLVTYLEVDPPARLVYRHAGDSDADPVHFTATITLEEAGPGSTRLTMRMAFPTPKDKHEAAKYGALEGGRQTMARLADHLAGGASEDAFVLHRVFDAPPERVWEAWTRPEHMMKWFSPKAWSLAVCEIDLRPGGSYHYCMRGEGFPEMWGLWIIRDVQPPERLEYVASFSDADRNIVRAPFSSDWPLEVLSSVTIEPHAGLAGGSVVTIRGEPINASEAERAAFRNGIASMHQGWGQTLDGLKSFLAEGE